MKTPYVLNREAIDDFMAYHGIKKLQDVAAAFGISSAYLSQVLSGSRPLNEFLRARIQSVTRLPQDKLFRLNSTEPAEQAMSYLRYYGVSTYKEGSKSQEKRDYLNKKDRPVFELAQELADGRSGYMKWAKK